MTLLSSFLKPNLGYIIHGGKKYGKLYEDAVAPVDMGEFARVKAENEALQKYKEPSTSPAPAPQSRDQYMTSRDATATGVANAEANIKKSKQAEVSGDTSKLKQHTAFALGRYLAGNDFHIAVPHDTPTVSNVPDSGSTLPFPGESDYQASLPSAEGFKPKPVGTADLRYQVAHRGRSEGQPRTRSTKFKQVLAPHQAVPHIHALAALAIQHGVTAEEIKNPVHEQRDMDRDFDPVTNPLVHKTQEKLNKVFAEYKASTGHSVVERHELPYKEAPSHLSADRETRLAATALADSDNFKISREHKNRAAADIQERHANLRKDHEETLDAVSRAYEKHGITDIPSKHGTAIVQGIIHLRQNDHSPRATHEAIIGGVNSYLSHVAKSGVDKTKPRSFDEHFNEYLDNFHEEHPPIPALDREMILDAHRGTIRSVHEDLSSRMAARDNALEPGAPTFSTSEKAILAGKSQPFGGKTVKPDASKLKRNAIPPPEAYQNAEFETAKTKFQPTLKFDKPVRTGRAKIVKGPPALTFGHFARKTGDFAYKLAQQGFDNSTISGAIKEVGKTFFEKHPYGGDEQFTEHLDRVTPDYLTLGNSDNVREEKHRVIFGTLFHDLHKKINANGIELSREAHHAASSSAGAELLDKGYSPEETHSLLKDATAKFIASHAGVGKGDEHYKKFLPQHLAGRVAPKAVKEYRFDPTTEQMAKDRGIDIEIDPSGRVVHKGTKDELIGIEAGGYGLPQPKAVSDTLPKEHLLIAGDKPIQGDTEDTRKLSDRIMRRVRFRGLPVEKGVGQAAPDIEKNPRFSTPGYATTKVVTTTPTAASHPSIVAANAKFNQYVGSAEDVPNKYMGDPDNAFDQWVGKGWRSHEIGTDSSNFSGLAGSEHNVLSLHPAPIKPSYVLHKRGKPIGAAAQQKLHAEAHALPEEDKRHLLIHDAFPTEAIEHAKASGATDEDLHHLALDKHLDDMGLPSLSGQEITPKLLSEWKDRGDEEGPDSKVSREISLRKLHAGMLKNPETHKIAKESILRHRKALEEDLAALDAHEAKGKEFGIADPGKHTRERRRIIEGQLKTIADPEQFAQAHLNSTRAWSRKEYKLDHDTTPEHETRARSILAGLPAPSPGEHSSITQERERATKTLADIKDRAPVMAPDRHMTPISAIAAISELAPAFQADDTPADSIGFADPHKLAKAIPSATDVLKNHVTHLKALRIKQEWQQGERQQTGKRHRRIAGTNSVRTKAESREAKRKRKG